MGAVAASKYKYKCVSLLWQYQLIWLFVAIILGTLAVSVVFGVENTSSPVFGVDLMKNSSNSMPWYNVSSVITNATLEEKKGHIKNDNEGANVQDSRALEEQKKVTKHWRYIWFQHVRKAGGTTICHLLHQWNLTTSAMLRRNCALHFDVYGRIAHQN
ncbi:hypothetical protein RFI_18379 [Reticulomyxa filosa]|uniref:Uncharacterized protein n=1 Tax=Reticulomyxa filosa TaxID=46433 RepID=X6MXY5_RETFI|nr:hypothetical protein RFI_18379 [Reticulomyxa filosa]|eukprot:ETO18865.1 hypothetical protein RFI_18379 [Reticulomyxa filosa]